MKEFMELFYQLKCPKAISEIVIAYFGLDHVNHCMVAIKKLNFFIFLFPSSLFNLSFCILPLIFLPNSYNKVTNINLHVLLVTTMLPKKAINNKELSNFALEG
jgi:hypothetical protein